MSPAPVFRPTPGKVIRIVAIAVIAVLLVVVLIDSFFILDARHGEHAIVQRFGRFKQEVVEPGIHFKLPFGIDRVTVERVTEVRRLEIGFRTAGAAERDHPESAPASIPEPEHSVVITQDQNLVDADYVVQYEIRSLKDYLFNVAYPDWTVRQAAKAVMREIIANRDIDDILTTGRDEIQAEALDHLQKVMDAYRVGIRIRSVQFQDVHAPNEVIPAFNDVQKAKEERETAMNEGKRYTNLVIPKAEGQGKKIVTEAEAYKIRRTNESTGDAARFLALHEAYLKNPDLIRRQLYLQAMGEILPTLDKTVVEEGAGTILLPVPSGKEKQP